MAQVNRVCKTCGKKYYFCSNCDKSLNSPQWMLLWHDLNCKDVFETVSDYAQGRITKVDAFRKLEKCDLKNMESFNESIKTFIREILRSEKITTNTESSKSSDFSESVPIKRRSRRRN